MDFGVFFPRHQNTNGMIYSASRSTDLLIVTDDRAGRLVVCNEPQIRLVIPHTERGRRNQHLNIVRQKLLLEVLPERVGIFKPVAIHTAEICLRLYSVRLKPVRNLLRIPLCGSVYDTRSW